MDGLNPASAKKSSFDLNLKNPEQAVIALVIIGVGLVLLIYAILTM